MVMKMVIDEVKKIVCETLEISDIDVDDDLVKIGMNSIEFVKIIVYVEESFDIEFPDELLALSKMNSIRSIYEVVKHVLDE